LRSRKYSIGLTNGVFLFIIRRMRAKNTLEFIVNKKPIRIERIGNMLRVCEGDYIVSMLLLDDIEGAGVKLELFPAYVAPSDRKELLPSETTNND
jgi:hypothetical protein